MEKGINKEKAHEMLIELLPKLNECITQAFIDFKSKFDQNLHVSSNTTNSSFIRDLIIDRVKQLADANSKHMWTTVQKRMFLLLIKTKAGLTFAIRFKKFTKYLKTSNVKTQQASDYNGQIPIPEISSDCSVIHLNAGYVLRNKTYSEISTHLTCPINMNELAWDFELSNSSLDQDNVIDLIGTRETSDSLTFNKSKLRIKTNGKSRKSTNKL